MSVPAAAPASLLPRLRQSDGRLVAEARFPSNGHLYEALVASLRVALGSLLMVLGWVLLQPSLAAVQGRPLMLAMTMALAAGFLWAGVRGLYPLDPVRLGLGREELQLSGPREAGLERPREALTGRRHELHRVPLGQLRSLRLDPEEGLQLNCEGRSLVVPSSYRKLVSRRGGLGFEIDHRCFSHEELVWLAEQIERLRQGHSPPPLESAPARLRPGPWTLRLLAVALGMLPALAYLLARP